MVSSHNNDLEHSLSFLRLLLLKTLETVFDKSFIHGCFGVGGMSA